MRPPLFSDYSVDLCDANAKLVGQFPHQVFTVSVGASYLYCIFLVDGSGLPFLTHLIGYVVIVCAVEEVIGPATRRVVTFMQHLKHVVELRICQDVRNTVGHGINTAELEAPVSFFVTMALPQPTLAAHVYVSPESSGNALWRSLAFQIAEWKSVFSGWSIHKGIIACKTGQGSRRVGALGTTVITWVSGCVRRVNSEFLTASQAGLDNLRHWETSTFSIKMGGMGSHVLMPFGNYTVCV